MLQSFCLSAVKKANVRKKKKKLDLVKLIGDKELEAIQKTTNLQQSLIYKTENQLQVYFLR